MRTGYGGLFPAVLGEQDEAFATLRYLLGLIQNLRAF